MSSNYTTYKRKTKRLIQFFLLIACAILFVVIITSSRFINKEVASDVATLCAYLVILCLYAFIFCSFGMRDDFCYYVDFTPDGKFYLDVEINNGPTSHYRFSLKTTDVQKIGKKQMRITNNNYPNDHVSLFIPYCKELEDDIIEAKSHSSWLSYVHSNQEPATSSAESDENT